MMGCIESKLGHGNFGKGMFNIFLCNVDSGLTWPLSNWTCSLSQHMIKRNQLSDCLVYRCE